MKEYTNNLKETMCEFKNRDQYYSVEFSIDGLVPYLFKIWSMAPASMSVLVKEGSNILPRLRPGETLHVKCYSTHPEVHTECLETAIRHITKNEQGRFKGHYLVGLEILDSQN